MRAAWIAVGTELLGTDRLDTNALSATALLRRHGVELRRKAVVGDHEGDLEGELRSLLGAYELVLVSGGLGPTAGDVTREAGARARRREPVCLAAARGGCRGREGAAPGGGGRRSALGWGGRGGGGGGGRGTLLLPPAPPARAGAN